MKHTSVAAAVMTAGLVMTSASAVDAAEQVSVGYEHVSQGNLNAFSGRGDLLVSFDNPGFQAQLSGGDKHLDISGVSVDLTDITANLFWRDRMGTFGASFTYHRLGAGVNINGFTASGSISAESYGVFGEYYFNKSLTFRVKGGGYSGDFEGYYGGAGLAFYPGRNMALGFTYDYVSMTGGGHTSMPGASFEVLPYEEWPATVGLNYTHETESGGSDIIGIVLKWHIGANGNDLRAWDRTGPIQWNGALNVPY
jgi:hypothetical protein